MYEISVDRTLRLVRARVIGALSPEMAAAYERNLKLEIENLSKIRPGFSLLIDLRESQIASKSNTDNLQSKMQWHIDHGLRKSAYLVKSAIHQLQIRRLAIDDRFNCFTSEEAAMAWLRN